MMDAASTGSIDFEHWDQGAPCPHCANWRQEMGTDAQGRAVIREWHDLCCPEFIALADASDMRLDTVWSLQSAPTPETRTVD